MKAYSRNKETPQLSLFGRKIGLSCILRELFSLSYAVYLSHPDTSSHYGKK